MSDDRWFAVKAELFDAVCKLAWTESEGLDDDRIVIDARSSAVPVERQSWVLSPSGLRMRLWPPVFVPVSSTEEHP